jgi:hypothetical protein
MAPQRLDSLLPSPSEPLADGSGRHRERGGDILLFPALLLQLSGASPLAFVPVEPILVGAHGVSRSSL